MSSTTTNENEIWPPANFTEWPSTRIGALIIDGIILLLAIIPVTRRVIFLNAWDCCCCCPAVIKAVVLGGLIGMFLHFIPCIWWTCDWGEYDGQAVRGGIWFIGGPIIAAFILCYECNRSKGDEGGDNNGPADIA
ncbi:expressed unknown protein [Seminavis robusta]|uniref:Transmembrane protein n=1 Tax=Seminavis robusta TaxID=568900 RepID=A0A9N8ERJ1_9STRA|nr:expressed unknown protein [Seminavis robusta]|eukprot:Sro1680_g290760.1 n/a (135) ;mRNA; r:5715-6119